MRIVVMGAGALRLGAELGLSTPMLFAVHATLAPHAGGRSSPTAPPDVN